jgi:hypothetical protein
MAEVTSILSAIEQGDPRAAEQLLPLVYDELRKLAAQRLASEGPGHTLQPTALVHEAYLKLVGRGQRPPVSGVPAFSGASGLWQVKVRYANRLERASRKMGYSAALRGLIS